MPVFTCGRFPDGEVPINTSRGLVTFVDGRAVVDDPEQAAALREVPAVFEIKQVVDLYKDVGGGGNHGPAPARPAETGRRPTQSAPKAAWAEWAVSHGMDPDQAGDLTKAQLIALADDLDKE